MKGRMINKSSEIILQDSIRNIESGVRARLNANNVQGEQLRLALYRLDLELTRVSRFVRALAEDILSYEPLIERLLVLDKTNLHGRDELLNFAQLQKELTSPLSTSTAARAFAKLKQDMQSDIDFAMTEDHMLLVYLPLSATVFFHLYQ